MISQKNGLRKVQNYVELSIEGPLSREFLTEVCLFVSQKDYEGIVEERGITKLCGYPLCENQLTKVYKQANIIRRSQVYNISKRKMFCSDACFKASEHLASQIPENPFWFRTSQDQPQDINFISHQIESFYPGTPVLTSLQMPPEDRKKVKQPNKIHSDIAKLVMDLESVTMGDAPSAKNLQKKVSPKDAEDKMKKLVKTFQENKILEPALEENVLPTTPVDKESVEKEPETVLRVEIQVPRPPHPEAPQNPEVTFLQATEFQLKKWFTLGTLQYVMGKDRFFEMCHSHSITVEHLFPPSHHDPDKMAGLRKYYRSLCSVLDEREKAEEEEDQKILKRAEKSAAPDSQTTGENSQQSSAKKPPQQKKNKPKRVSHVKSSDPDGEEEGGDLLLALPYIDDIHQKKIRASLVFNEIQNMIMKFLSPVIFQYNQDVIRLINTFHLTSDTLHCSSPLVWALVTLCLVKMVSLKHPGEALDDAALVDKMEALTSKMGTSLTDLHAMLDNVLVSLLPGHPSDGHSHNSH